MKDYFIHHLELLVGIVMGMYGTLAAVFFLLAIRSRTPVWKFIFHLLTGLCIAVAVLAGRLPL